MKYEMIFGDEKLFDGAPLDSVCVERFINTELVSVYVHHRTIDALLNTLIEREAVSCASNRPDIAMRRIIAEPKRWTAEDQKAGMLPDVGYEYIGRDVLLTCVFVDKNRDVWGKSKDNLMYCHDYSEIKPIETPEEKAQRLRSEWISKAYVDFHRLGCELEVLQKEQIKQIYDALLSGELTMPNKDGE